MNQQQIGDVYTIHLVGAELQFEADTLDKWETFFLHLVPTLVECRVVFVGPELNNENLPLEILSRIRLFELIGYHELDVTFLSIAECVAHVARIVASLNSIFNVELCITTMPTALASQNRI